MITSTFESDAGDWVVTVTVNEKLLSVDPEPMWVPTTRSCSITTTTPATVSEWVVGNKQLLVTLANQPDMTAAQVNELLARSKGCVRLFERPRP